MFERLKTAYHMLFYKVYQSIQFTSKDGFEHWKASIVVDALGILTFVEILVCLEVLLKDSFQLPENTLLLLPFVFLIITANYFIFHHKDQWKTYAVRFRKLPKARSRLYSWLTLGFVLAVVGGLIFSFYQMSQIDWSHIN